MVSFIPSFPAHTGPHRVGTADVEIPVSELSSPSPGPDSSISTVSTRIFYPCAPVSKPKRAYWFADPQHDYLASYFRFAGASSSVAHYLAYFPRIAYYIALPCASDAPILQPTTASGRWPVMVFSHGLGGSRNMYSHLAGSLASHGCVVVCPEHRDGSGSVSVIRDADGKPGATVPYNNISHKQSQGVHDSRHAQLAIRTWELGLVYDLLVRMDKGDSLSNYAVAKAERGKKDVLKLDMFAGMLDVHRPGAVHWMGHSFGAATVHQFVKSVYYASQSHLAPASYKPLYTPRIDSSLVQQITPRSNVTLLDCWMMTILDPNTTWLRNKPLPCYQPGGTGGSAILAVMSENFFKWNANLREVKRSVSWDPAVDPHDLPSRLAATISSPSNNGGNGKEARPTNPPYIFYPVKSTHLSQSDFGVLFPWLASRFSNVTEHERILRLNCRAILEVWRQNGAELEATSDSDMDIVHVKAKDEEKTSKGTKGAKARKESDRKSSHMKRSMIWFGSDKHASTTSTASKVDHKSEARVDGLNGEVTTSPHLKPPDHTISDPTTRDPSPALSSSSTLIPDVPALSTDEIKNTLHPGQDATILLRRRAASGKEAVRGWIALGLRDEDAAPEEGADKGMKVDEPLENLDGGGEVGEREERKRGKEGGGGRKVGVA